MGRLDTIKERLTLTVEQYSTAGALLMTWRIRPLGAAELYRYPGLLKELIDGLAPRQGTREVDPDIAAAEALAAAGGASELSRAESRTAELLAVAEEVIEAVDTGDGAGWSPVCWIDDHEEQREGEDGTLYLHRYTLDTTTLAILAEQAMSRFSAAQARAARFPGGVTGRPGDPAPADGSMHADQPLGPAGGA